MNQVDMRAVAERAGVSPSTVSRALRGLASVTDETRNLVERTAADLGYTVSASASSLASGRHRMIAAVVPSITGWYHAAALEGADEVFRDAKYDVMLVNLGHATPAANRLFHTSLLKRRVDGVLVIALDFTKQEAEQLQSLRMPHIGVGAALTSTTRVEIDEVAAAELATEHLLRLGHRRIAHIGGRDDPDTDSTMAMLRAAGWTRAMQRANQEPRPSWSVDGGFTTAQARSAARTLLSMQERPTAIFAASDEMAFGVLQAAQDLKLQVPRDLSVVGIDDHPYAELLGLTTVRQSPAQQGRAAASLLLAGLDAPSALEPGDEAGQRVEAPIELVGRRSTASPLP